MPTFQSALAQYNHIFANANFLHTARQAYTQTLIHKMVQNLAQPAVSFLTPGVWNTFKAAVANHTLNTGNVLQCAQWLEANHVLGTTPLEYIEQALGSATMVGQFRLDVAMWYGALTVNNNAKQVAMLRRMFLLLQRVGMFVRLQGGAWHQWFGHHGTSVPLACALSHGGRVLVQIPAGQHGVAVWNWVWGMMNVANYVRKGATHETSFKSKAEILHAAAGNYNKYFDEKKTTLNGSGMHFGVNIPLGGEGNENPFSGNTIEQDGAHGHLYIHYNPPQTNRMGSIMFACEDSAPIDQWNPNAIPKNIFKYAAFGIKGKFKKSFAPTQTSVIPVGDKGSPGTATKQTTGWCVGQTGHAHRLGDAGHFSATGGMKWKDTGWHPGYGPQVGNDAMFVDLSNPYIAQALIAKTANDFNPDHLGRDCNPPAFNAGHLNVHP